MPKHTIPLMWLLSRRKLRLADALGSRALRTDAVESISCGRLSFVVVIGLLAQFAFGAWWIDSVTSLTLMWFLVKEGPEAFESEVDDFLRAVARGPRSVRATKKRAFLGQQESAGLIARG